MRTAVKETKVETNFPAEEISRGFLEAAIGDTPLIRLRHRFGHQFKVCINRHKLRFVPKIFA